MIEILSYNAPEISVFKSLRGTPSEILEKRLFIAEGEKVFAKLLNSNLEIVSIFATSKYYEKYKEEIEQKHLLESRKFTASKQIMEQIVGFHLHTGVMALARQPEDTELAALGERIVVLNGVIDAENVGSIVRNAVAFGFDSLIYDNSSSCPFLRRAVRVSMGNIFCIKTRRENDLVNTINTLKAKGYEIVAAELNERSININNVRFKSKIAIIFGNEGFGVAQQVLEVSDKIVSIPISDKVNSLNVASSSAIILFFANNNSI